MSERPHGEVRAERFAAFEALRPRLSALAYRMLGSQTEAEDAIQDAALRWGSTDAEPADVTGYLVRTTTHLCIDRLRSAQKAREDYVGPWLPEPVVAPLRDDPEHSAELADSLQIALLVLLETLHPRERAAFVLREAFGFSYREVAEALGTTEANARQIARRARGHVGTRRLARPEKREAERLVRAFLHAARNGDLTALTPLLNADVSLTSDGGGVVPSALRVIKGADRVGRFVVGVTRKLRQRGAEADVMSVGGMPGLIYRKDGATVAAWSFEILDSGVRAVYVVINPDKLDRDGSAV